MVSKCFVIHVYISQHFLFLSVGIFFLFGAGRLSLCRAQPEQAIKYYCQAIRAQSQYRNLHHISYWEMAIAHLALWDVKSSLACWTELEKESTVSQIQHRSQRVRYLPFFKWSKSIYSYGMAVCLLESEGDYDDDEMKKNRRSESKAAAAGLMARVQGLRQKIAGKSIPLEVRSLPTPCCLFFFQQLSLFSSETRRTKSP